ncbi:MAG TPA: DUF2027 domain-containing protein, partial [Bacteroidales bacterium]|nr:DUF2027 domain-containing protein [Bacteroidales bacterium]
FKEMKVKVGDKVKFLNDTGSGTVNRIMDQKTALVQIDGGFEVPWLISDLVVSSGSYGYDPEIEQTEDEASDDNSFSETIEPEEESAIDDEEVVMAFVPAENSSELEVYLVNVSSYRLKFIISRQQENELVLFHEGSLQPGLKINMGTYLPGNMGDEEVFRVQALFYNAGFFVHVSPVDMLIRIKAADLYDSSKLKSNDYFTSKAMLYTLHSWQEPVEQPSHDIDSEALKKAMLTKGDVKQKKKEVPKKNLPEEVDLHIAALADNHKDLEPGEILDIQLAAFRTSLESAILHNKRRIVFIHGVGNGKLKHEIRRLIEREYSRVNYQDASFKEYGYGATMAIIG